MALSLLSHTHHCQTELVGERVYVRVQCGMKVPDRERTRVGNSVCAEGSRERGDEKRGRRQRKDRYSTLADLDAHGFNGRGTVHPAITCFSRRTRPGFPSIAISDAPLAASLATLNHPTRLLLLPSPTPQTQDPLNLALHSTADCSPCLRLDIDVVSIVGSL
jgi:hypothetical protein